MPELPAERREPSPNRTGYDNRYLAGIARFNAGEYFEAHEVWEDLWMECPSAERRFFQALIQAAVSLYHWGNGNRAGADRLFHSGQRYMEPYRPKYQGLDVDRFWSDVETVFTAASRDSRPTIVLDPPPGRWPELSEAHHE